MLGENGDLIASHGNHLGRGSVFRHTLDVAEALLNGDGYGVQPRSKRGDEVGPARADRCHL